jgi:polysaccharide deacetylase family protein (PEP-CTERM system associated)
MNAPVRNALTVDVEDYFQVSAFREQVSPNDWATFESRVVANTHRVMDLFDEAGTTGTFFVLGWIAEQHPQLVRQIADRGHEIACHGFSHQLIYGQSQQAFTEETHRAKALLEDQAQVPVHGYRAASFSITAESRWALDVLADCGFAYDSSMYPVRHDLYGTAVASRGPHRIVTPNGKPLIEFPMSARSIMGMTVPASGGGYFRLYPYALSAYLLRAVNADAEPFVFYMHPWEIDPGQPRIRASLKSRIRHYVNLDRCEAKLRILLRDFRFTSMAQVLADYPIAAVDHAHDAAAASGAR